MTISLASLSDSLSRLVAFGAQLLTAIQIGPNRHITGLLCPGGTILTTDQMLPALDSYTVVLPNRSLAPGYPHLRDPASNLASLQFDPAISVRFPDIGPAAPGGLVVVLGADSDASPTVRLTVVHRILCTADGPVAVLDMPAAALDPGGCVLDAEGRLIGIAAPGPGGEVIVIPGSLIIRAMRPRQTGTTASPPPEGAAAPSLNRRGWLGLALQPTIVPDQLVGRAGQTSGRMVVKITAGGPADRAGMRVGDVLLSLNGLGMSGSHGLRSFLAEEHIGGTVGIKLLRDGSVLTTHLIIAEQP